MSTTPSIDDLDPTAVQQAEAFLAGWLAPQYPSMDLNEGVFRNLLIRAASSFHVLNQTLMAELQASQSLQAVSADPAGADPAVVDAILSNYRVTRKEGTTTAGTVVIIISYLRSVSIPVTTIFTANGLNFVVTQPYVAVTDAASVLTDQQRLISARSDGTYSFTVPVVASAAGSDYNLRVGTRFSMDPTVTGFVDAYALEDFSGGTDTETNEELIARLDEAIVQKVMSGRVQIASLLSEQWANLRASSIVGFGDEEMLRDRHNMFGISTGGKADLYCRTEYLPLTTKLTREAVLIDKTNGTWQMSILRDDAPGFYEIQAILPTGVDPDQNSLTKLSETRGLDLTPDSDEDISPDVANVTEGAYTRYQTAVVTFTDTSGDLSGLTVNESRRSYDVYFYGLPGIKELQRYVMNRENRNPQADYLVRAPIPAFVTVSLTIGYQGTGELPDVTPIKTAVASRVNELNFQLGRLPASIIYDAVHDIIPKPDAYVMSPIDIVVMIRQPGGTYVKIRSGDQIEIPDDPANAVTQRTAIFYLDADDVDVLIERVPSIQV
jgi:hypothetical protein